MREFGSLLMGGPSSIGKTKKKRAEKVVRIIRRPQAACYRLPYAQANTDANLTKKDDVFVVILVGWSGVGRYAS